MTSVLINRNRQGRIVAFESSGHADPRSRKGNDIYCAAISAILQTAVVALSDYAKVQIRQEIQDGYLDCELLHREDADREDVRAILEGMYLGLVSFSKENGKFIKILEEVL